MSSSNNALETEVGMSNDAFAAVLLSMQNYDNATDIKVSKGEDGW